MTTQCNGLLIAEQPIERNFCIKVFQKITFKVTASLNSMAIFLFENYHETRLQQPLKTI